MKLRFRSNRPAIYGGVVLALALLFMVMHPPGVTVTSQSIQCSAGACELVFVLHNNTLDLKQGELFFRLEFDGQYDTGTDIDTTSEAMSDMGQIPFRLQAGETKTLKQAYVYPVFNPLIHTEVILDEP